MLKKHQEETIALFDEKELTCCECINGSNDHDTRLKQFILSREQELVRKVVEECKIGGYITEGEDYDEGWEDACKELNNKIDSLLKELE